MKTAFKYMSFCVILPALLGLACDYRPGDTYLAAVQDLTNVRASCAYESDPSRYRAPVNMNDNIVVRLNYQYNKKELFICYAFFADSNQRDVYGDNKRIDEGYEGHIDQSDYSFNQFVIFSRGQSSELPFYYRCYLDFIPNFQADVYSAFYVMSVSESDGKVDCQIRPFQSKVPS